MFTFPVAYGAGPRVRRLVFLLVVLGIAACTAASSDPYPLNTGRWWYYRTTTSILDEFKEQRLHVANVGAATADGMPVTVQRSQGRWDTLVTRKPAGIFRIVTRGRTPPQEFLLLPTAANPAAQWQLQSELNLIESRTFAPEDRLQGRHIPVTLTVRIGSQRETVRLAAAEFADCLRTDAVGTTTVMTDRGHHPVEVGVAEHAWYAPGIGLVKTVRNETSASPFLRDGHYTQELLEWGH